MVSPRNITVSTILQYVRRGRIHSVHTLREGFGELIEAEALETSELVGKPLKEVKLPQGVLLGAIVREGKMICPRGSTVVQAKDRVVLFAAEDVIRKVFADFKAADLALDDAAIREKMEAYSTAAAEQLMAGE